MLKARDAPNGAPEASYESLHLKPEAENCLPKGWILKQVQHFGQQNPKVFPPLRLFVYAAQQRVDQHEVFVPTDVKFNNKT